MLVPSPTVDGERPCGLLQLPCAMPFETRFGELASEVLSAEAFIALNAAWPLMLLMPPSTTAEAAEPDTSPSAALLCALLYGAEAAEPSLNTLLPCELLLIALLPCTPSTEGKAADPSATSCELSACEPSAVEMCCKLSATEAGCILRSSHASSMRRSLRRVQAMIARAWEAMTVAAAA